MNGISPDAVPSRQETELRAADDREARRDRALDVAVGVFIVLALAVCGWAVYRIGGGWS